MAADAAVVVVNFNSGEYLPGCLAALAPQHQAGLAAEIVVVDNASPRDQTRALAEAEASGARVLRLERNTGYAGGCNRGLAATRAPHVFLLNADVVAGAGALPLLLRHLEQHPAVGLAEPRLFVDAGWAWMQPEFRAPTPGTLALDALARHVPALARRRGRAELRRQLPGWRASAPRTCTALSGAFLAARRAALTAIGGFDEDYPLAYEDTDLFRRLRAAGWALELVPAARAIHLAHRSRLTVVEESLAKDRLGRRRYLRRHHGRAALWLDQALERLETLAQRRPRAPAGVRDLGRRAEPPVLELDGPPGPFVLQLALEPEFRLAVGHLGTGDRHAFAPETWSSLLPLRLHLRAHALPDLRPRGAWSFERAPA